MDRIFAALLGGTAFAVSWAVGGAVFGGTVRVFAQRWHRAPERTAGGAFRKGAASGAVVTAVLGFLAGGLIGYRQAQDPTPLSEQVLASCFILGGIATLAVVLGSVAYGLEWLGTSGRGDRPSDAGGHGG